jgi:hypothetical protein
MNYTGNVYIKMLQVKPVVCNWMKYQAASVEENVRPTKFWLET